jgi:hypothetical protein
VSSFAESLPSASFSGGMGNIRAGSTTAWREIAKLSLVPVRAVQGSYEKGAGIENCRKRSQPRLIVMLGTKVGMG